MPEGHSIHILARDHTRDLAGQHLAVSSPQGRFAEAAALLDGRRLEAVEPYGKHLFYWFGPRRDEVPAGAAPPSAGAPPGAALGIHVHLGLYGKFHRTPAPPAGSSRQVRLRLASDREVFDLVGPTACELVTSADRDALVARLGPDLLAPRPDPEPTWRALRRRRGSIGQAVMDQALFAGVGNIFRAESLHVCGIHPLRPANDLVREEFDALWSTLVAMMRRSRRARRIVTVERAERGRRSPGATEPRYVYKRTSCLRCGSPVRRFDLAGRWAYACESCQPPPSPGG